MTAERFASKQSEKDYGGATTLAESLPLIHDFAIAVSALDVAPTHLILDLGAGACWCSEWLQRLNLRTVSVDISLELLQVGRTRLLQSGSPRIVAGDIECLPFASATFDRVICLNALNSGGLQDSGVRIASRA
jgi:2-polyprenyl-3-methyl-5-hydroxy-6-metoxy-1,4-benzoquinol methylase